MLRRHALLTGCLMFAVIAGTPALAAYAIAFNPSSGRAAAYNGSFDYETAKRVATRQMRPWLPHRRLRQGNMRRGGGIDLDRHLVLGRGEG